jgi:hypothetical protein
MKVSLCIISFVICSQICKSQGIGIGTVTPDSSAAVDVTSTAKGFLPPRMTFVQRIGISKPAKGLVVYQIDSTTGLYLYKDTAWWKLAVETTHFVGENFGGGIVFFVFDNGKHGLIAATSDQSTGIRWNAGSNLNTRARANGVGAGLKNTAIIIGNQAAGDGNPYAATVCNEYFVTENGVTYGDWYLPSKDELNLLYLKKNMVGGFTNGFYWSSTEYDQSGATALNFGIGIGDVTTKSFLARVRPIRSF